jgi:pyrophosphatase PpaX
MKPKIEAVIFDADGTILDTRELIFQAIRNVLIEHGYEAPEPPALAPLAGRTIEEIYIHFAPNHDSKALGLKHKAFQLEHLDLFSAYEGLEKLLNKLKKDGIKIGLCTSRRENVMQFLEYIGIKEYFDTIVHADLVTNYKPHPEGLQKALDEIKVLPAHAVMVGDTEFDIGAGKATGVAFTVGITHGSRTADQLKDAGADYVIDHLNDIIPLITEGK